MKKIILALNFKKTTLDFFSAHLSDVRITDFIQDGLHADYCFIQVPDLEAHFQELLETVSDDCPKILFAKTVETFDKVSKAYANFRFIVFGNPETAEAVFNVKHVLKNTEFATRSGAPFGENYPNSSSALLRKVLDTSKNFVFSKNDKSEFILINSTFADYFETNRFDCIGQSDVFFDYLSPEKRKNLSLLQSGIKQLTTNALYSELQINFDTNGKTSYYDTETFRMFDKGLNTYIYLVYARNTTIHSQTAKEILDENMKLENRLLNKIVDYEISISKFKQLIENSPDFIFITDTEGIITEANKRFHDFTQIRNLETQNYSTILPLFILPTDLESSSESAVETVLLSPGTGKTLAVEISLAHSKVRNTVAGTIFIARDISFQKEYRKQFMHAILQTEERERNRFSKELHDGMGATLSAAKMYLDAISENDFDMPTIQEFVRRATEFIGEAASSAREIARNIKPHILSNFGLSKSLELLCKRITETNKIQLNFKAEKHNQTLPEEVELALYRISYELINNTLKHSVASLAQLSICTKDNEIILNYFDNGTGFEARNIKTNTSGITNIRSRIELLGGVFILESGIGKGVNVTIKLPINSN